MVLKPVTQLQHILPYSSHLCLFHTCLPPLLEKLFYAGNPKEIQ
jgi:hypothetical protein